MVYKGRLVGIISASDVIAVTPDLVDVISEKAPLLGEKLVVRQMIYRDTVMNVVNGLIFCSIRKELLHVKNVELKHPTKIRPVFFADAMLGSIARKLRVFGFDTLYIRDINDDDVLEIASKLDRVILTCDKELFKRILKIGDTEPY